MSDERSNGPPEGANASESGSRDVVVPLRVYKTVTVFSTLIAIVAVVGGFVLLDQATNRARLPVSELDVPVAIAGLALIVLGSVVYAFSTRFRTEEMGKPKDDADEAPDDG